MKRSLVIALALAVALPAVTLPAAPADAQVLTGRGAGERVPGVPGHRLHRRGHVQVRTHPVGRGQDPEAQELAEHVPERVVPALRR